MAKCKVMLVCAVAAMMMVAANATAVDGDAAAATCKPLPDSNLAELFTRCYPAIRKNLQQTPSEECCIEVKAILPCLCKSKHTDFSFVKAVAILKSFAGNVIKYFKNKFTKPKPVGELAAPSWKAVFDLPKKCGCFQS